MKVKPLAGGIMSFINGPQPEFRMIPNTGDMPGDNQQDYKEPDDPYEGIDVDLLDEKTKGAIEKARAERKTFLVSAKNERTYQSQLDKSKAELQRLQNIVNGQQQQQQQKNQEPTMEERFYEIYKAEGLDDENARKVSKIQARIYAETEKQTDAKINKVVTPVATEVLSQGAEMMFEQMIQTNPRLQDPEIALEAWKLVTDALGQGMAASPGLIDSLSKIAAIDVLDKRHAAGHNGNNQDGHQQQQQQKPVVSYPGQQHQQQQQPSITNGGTRYTFPGSGNMNLGPGNPTNANGVDPDTLKALAATSKIWADTYDIKGKPPEGPSRIVRSRR